MTLAFRHKPHGVFSNAELMSLEQFGSPYVDNHVVTSYWIALCFFISSSCSLTTHYQICIKSPLPPTLKVETAMFAEMLKNLQHPVQLMA
jgi:hypothetical protein